MTVNKRLALARKTLKMTQREFAEKTSASTGFAAFMERGNRRVNTKITNNY
jgi:transcriptional regulator with XRE-family HTH domain